MWFYNEFLLSSYGTRQPCLVHLLSYTRMNESHDHVATPFFHPKNWNMFKLPLRRTNIAYVNGSFKDHATNYYWVMLAFPLIAMLAHQGPLFVPASTGYNELRYVYTVFKIDFTEKRRASDSSASNARLQSNIEQGSRLSTQASIANIPYSQHSEQMNNVYYLIPLFFLLFSQAS